MIYEFSCAACDQTFDVERPIRDCAKPVACQDCGAPATRVWSSPTLSFPGGESADGDILTNAYVEREAKINKAFGLGSEEGAKKQALEAGKAQDAALLQARRQKRSSTIDRAPVRQVGSVNRVLRNNMQQSVGRDEWRTNKNDILESKGLI